MEMQNDEGETKTIIQNNSAQNNEANTNGKMTEARTTVPVPSANRKVNAKHTPETVGEECKDQTTDITKQSLVEETNKTATNTTNDNGDVIKRKELNNAHINISQYSKKKKDIEDVRFHAKNIEQEQKQQHAKQNAAKQNAAKQKAKANIEHRIQELKAQLREMEHESDDNNKGPEEDYNSRTDIILENDTADKAHHQRSLVEEIDASTFALKYSGYSSLGNQVLSTKPNSSQFAIVPGKTLTEPELIIKAKRDIPAAARYNVKQRYPQPLPGGNFANSSERKEVKPDNWDNPGPARYGDTASSMLPKGGRFNKSIVPTFLDLAERKGSRLPAPSDYVPSHRPARHGSGLGAKWGT
jgi:hypothetical protein